MLPFRTLLPWLLLLFLGLSSAARNKNRGGNRSVTAAPGRAQRSGSKSGASGRGKFSIDEDKMQCTWVAKDVPDGVRVSVKCENPEARITGGVTDLECQYNGKPQLCPAYQSNPKGFWKQVSRGFKKLQGKACKDDRTLVRALMCKRAPRDVHFKLDITSSVASAQSGGYPKMPPSPRTTTKTTTTTTTSAGPAAPDATGPTACIGRVDHKKKAENYCNSSWASVCAFFFSMLQSDEC